MQQDKSLCITTHADSLVPAPRTTSRNPAPVDDAAVPRLSGHRGRGARALVSRPRPAITLLCITIRPLTGGRRPTDQGGSALKLLDTIADRRSRYRRNPLATAPA